MNNAIILVLINLLIFSVGINVVMFCVLAKLCKEYVADEKIIRAANEVLAKEQ